MVPRRFLLITAAAAAFVSIVAIGAVRTHGRTDATASLPSQRSALYGQMDADDAWALRMAASRASIPAGDFQEFPDPKPLSAAKTIIASRAPLVLPAENARIPVSPDLADSEPAPDAPVSDPSSERPPFALSLLLVDLRYGIRLAVSPITYPDRPACELAGQQWLLEIHNSGAAPIHEAVTCLSQRVDRHAMMERRRAAAPAADQPR